MKNLQLIGSLIATLIFYGIPTQAQITFKVKSVKKADTLLEEVAYQEVVEDLLIPSEEKVEMAANFSEKITIPKLQDYSIKPYGLIKAPSHPFAYAVHLAYAEHRPLVISPDMIWLLIMQGFAEHIDENAENLRKKLVNFEGKRQLNVKRSYLKEALGPEDDYWPLIIEEFGEQIEYNTGPNLYSMASQNFSTTTEIEKTAFQITLMDAMSNFFGYSVEISCGIPEITLEGSPQDWEQLERLILQLKRYGLRAWVNDLKPILHQFSQASKGKVKHSFWEKIYKEEKDTIGCGEKVTYISGWLLHFFPFAQKKANAKSYSTRKIDQALEFEDLPGALSIADVLIDNYGRFYKYQFVSGFFGIKQDAQSLALRPEIGWAIIDTSEPPDEQMIKLYLEFKNRDIN